MESKENKMKNVWISNICSVEILLVVYCSKSVGLTKRWCYYSDWMSKNVLF
jgi:hypothetical protein